MNPKSVIVAINGFEKIKNKWRSRIDINFDGIMRGLFDEDLLKSGFVYYDKLRAIFDNNDVHLTEDDLNVFIQDCRIE
jgi:hypothetical protein